MLNNIIIEDLKAKRQYMNGSPVTNEWWYNYKGRDVDSIGSGAIIIPSDRLADLSGSVYNNLLAGQIEVDKNGTLTKCPDCYNGFCGGTKPNSYITNYIVSNKRQYDEVIEDFRSLVDERLTYESGVKSSLYRTIADDVALKYGFVECYSGLKSEMTDEFRNELKKKPVRLDMDQLDKFDPGINQQYVNIVKDAVFTVVNTGAVDKEAEKKIFGEFEKLFKDHIKKNPPKGLLPDLSKSDEKPVVYSQPAQPVAEATSEKKESNKEQKMSSATAASVVNVGPSAPLHRAPVDQEPKARQAFTPDGSGNVNIDVTAMATDTPVDTPLVDVTPVMGVTTPVGIPTPQPQVGANQAPTMQPQVRLRRDRGDMQDINTPRSDMPAGGILMDKNIILQQYPAFKLIEDKLDPSQFESIYRNDGNFIYVDIYPVGKDKTPENRIDWMSMTVDASGHIYGGGVAKFWPGSDNKEPVDFMPALHLIPEAIEAYWNGEKPIPQQHYYAVATTAELNRKIDISSIFFNDFNVKDAPAVIKTLTEVAKNTKVNGKLKDGRLRMFSYKSPKEFVLIADDKVLKYVGGPKANSDIQSFTVSVSNGKVAAVV